MASHSKILNISKNCKIKRSQAIHRIAGGVAVWVEEGFSIRELTLPERLAARAQSAETERFGNMLNELPGLKWEPPTAERYSFRLRYPILRQAQEFLRASQ